MEVFSFEERENPAGSLVKSGGINRVKGKKGRGQLNSL